MSLIQIRNRTNNMSKVVIWVATGALIIGGGFMGLGSFINPSVFKTQAQQSSGEDIVAKVNGEPILRSVYSQTLDRYQRQMTEYGGGNMNGPLASGQLHSTALNQAIEQVLLIQVAKKRGLQATSADVEAQQAKAVDSVRQELGLKAGATLQDVDNELAKNGQPAFDRLFPKDRFEAAALAAKYNALLTRLSTPSDDKVAEYYTSMHTEHILIDTKSRPDAQAADQARKIIDMLDKSNGSNFEQLAKTYSDDPGTKAKGGDDGWINGQTPYVEQFMNAARLLKPGQWTQAPVSTPQFGYFIIKLLATRNDMPKDFTKNKAQYVEQIASAATQKLEAADMDAAQKAMKVVVTDPQLAADWALMSAFKDNGAAGGKPAPAVLNKVIAAYDAALKTTTDSLSKEQMQAQRGLIFRILGKTDEELAALEAADAAASGTDPDLAMQIGDLCKKKGDTPKALTEYQNASKLSYDNPSIHLQLLQTFKDLNRSDLADAESKWLKDYSARQKAASSQQGMPAGMPPQAPSH